mmetsp:Transcript_40316/g.95772  ORF Transcript_40316/g.95772 Transcript_40316/m.95772 type:complete len:299 (+) Transcript_40316:64-960(+)
MPPKKTAKPAAKATKAAVSKVVKAQGAIAKKAAAGKAAAPKSTGGSRGGTRSAGAAAAPKSPAKAPAKAPAKVPAKKAAAAAKAPAPSKSKSVAVAAGQAPNLVANTNIYVEGSTVWACDLAYVDRAQNSDKFYNMRILVDTAGTAFWCTQQWGRTGTSGQSNIDGPFPTADHGKAVLEDTFQRKTGNVWGAPFKQKSGKYNLIKKDFGAARTATVKWEYHLTNDPLGKPDGWYPYDGDVVTAGSAMSNMEEYWEQFQGNAWLDTRFVDSGQFTYKVDFNKMEQTNTRSNKTRPIRRA